MTYWEKADGGLILITFTQPLIGTIEGNQSHFTVSWYEYNYVPDGVLVSKTGTVLATYQGSSTEQIILEMQSTSLFRNAVGNITVSYDGEGTLFGDHGDVAAFEVSFIPVGLIAKNNPNESEHLEITNATKNAVLSKIEYIDAKLDEHLEITNATKIANLIEIQYPEGKLDEHLEITNATKTANLIHVDYRNYKNQDEHLEIVNATVTSALIYSDT